MVMGQLREVVSQLEGARNEALRAQRNAEQARQEAERAREEAENANHSKSEFLSRMSHELRTPLNAILGFGQLLQMDSTMPPKRRASVDHILTAGEHLLNLINEVLDISRIDVGNLSLSLEPIAAQSAVEEALGLMRPLAEPHHIALHNEISESLNRYVLADRQRLKQVLLNLISNAIKYNRPRGSVTLRAEDHPEDRLRISVIDTGNGLSPADLAKLFTPFERLGATMTRIEGTGIGLVLSRRLAEAMGGQIGVHSELGVGSTFWVELPLTADPKLEVQAQLQQTEHFEPAVPSSVAEHTILYIEDNLPNLELVEMMLQDRSDVRLLSASLGVAGLKLAIEHHPALILLDFHLPDMNGDEILGRLRGRPETRDIPVVIISADATPGQIQRGLAAGASEYLTKPINVRQFLKIVETCLDGTPETGTDSPA
jgi:signal transduction histidine kinase/ActR/RegA family two-component response regulator